MLDHRRVPYVVTVPPSPPGEGAELAGLRGRAAVPRGAPAEPWGAARRPGPPAAPPAGALPPAHVERQARAAPGRAAPRQAGALMRRLKAAGCGV